jgi:ribosomal protein RSM22 (predicted rRNA methylase)
VKLPGDLDAAVAAWMAAHGRGGLAASAQQLSASYRKGGSSSQVNLAAYVASRLPATFKANVDLQQALAAALPGFAPRTLLDMGAGPGVATWAAVQAWATIEKVTQCEQDKNFATLAAELNAASGFTTLTEAEIILKSEATLPPDISADLVTVSYVLAEMPLEHMAQIATRLWARARQVLVVIEPGTPQGFSRLRTVREALLKQGAFVVAPCTHQNTCPMVKRPPQSFGQLPQQVEGAQKSNPSLSFAGGGGQRPEGGHSDWCHFKTRVQRSREHMHAKQATVPFEDEAFSYLVLSRNPVIQTGARVVAPVVVSKPGVSLRLCDASGLRDVTVASRDKPTYKRAKKTAWGHVWE